MEVFEISEKPELLKKSVQYFWEAWGNENNFRFYEDCMLNSLNDKNGLPKFFIGIEDGQIIASYALLVNDLISRQDLCPWFACLHVDEAGRNKGHGGTLLNHGLAVANRLGHDTLYLSTDLEGFYEKKGWQLFAKGYGVSGDAFSIYARPTG